MAGLYDYGNARVAAVRGRLLDSATLRRIADSDSPSAFLAALERFDDWRLAVREAEPLFGEPQAAIDAAIERHESARLGSLIGWYEGEARRLVEALVLPLDANRIVAIIRRRSAGATDAEAGLSIVAGAVLDGPTMARLARASSLASLITGLAGTGIVGRADAAALRTGVEDRRGLRWLEEQFVAAIDRARDERATGPGRDAAVVRELLAAERAERTMTEAELAEAGPASAWFSERAGRLARLDAVAARGRRDPLGIGAVAGYVAAVEAQAIRLRASLTAIVAGWSPEIVTPFIVAARS
jgi:vacuolar-type H+-ATPase subunit C/Vma6